MTIFRGWLELAGLELANSSRVVTLARRAELPSSDAVGFGAAACTPCRNVEVARDDSWPGLGDYLGDPAYDDITTAPWYDATTPASSEFYGVWVMSAEGFDAIPVARDIADAVDVGGVSGRHRDTYRTLNVSALVWACTHRGAAYGLRWLNRQLRAARTPQVLRYLSAHPETGSAAGLDRSMRRVVLTAGAVVNEVAGRPTRDHQQASVLRVDWELTALDPYEWTAPTSIPIEWDSEEVAGIEWAHAPDCVGDTACQLPELLSVTCPPQVVNTRPAPTPVCGGCLPVCELETRIVEVDLTGTGGDLVAVSVEVTAGEDPVTVQMHWRPCVDADPCEDTGHLQINGLPADSTVLADSVSGRPVSIIDGQRRRQRGIVGTPTGRPWRATLLPPGCWELVAQSAPGLEYTVTVTATGRTA